MQKLVFNHVSILTAMIPDPAITGHARPLIARLELPMCFQPDGGISDSSSESDEGDEDIHRQSLPPRPLVPELQRDSLYRWFEMRATWDLLTRPDGLSMRALRNLFVQAHGEPSPMWFSVIVDSGWFEIFIPTRLPLAPLVLEEEGVIFTCLESVAHVRLVDCTRPGPLGNPFPVGDDQDVAIVCDACDELMLSGGAAAAVPLRIDVSYLSESADVKRETELRDLASYVAHGGGIHLRCSASCAARRRRHPDARCHIFGIEVAIRARVRLAPIRPAAYFPASLGESSYHPSRLASTSQAPLGRVENSRVHVKRAPLPLDLHLRSIEAQPAPSLVVAIAQAPQELLSSQGVALIPSSAFFGVSAPPILSATEAPTAFSHRRLEPCTPGELLLMPFPKCNLPTWAPREDPPPPDQPDLVAFRLEEIISRGALRQLRQWAKRANRAIALAIRGDARAAREARPDDLRLKWDRNTHYPFQGVPMDLTVYPFRSLQPSRWPDRPPNAEIDIRRFRREFRAHPDYGDRQLRGLLSHGAYCGEPTHPISYYAVPHGSAFINATPWCSQMAAEVRRGWGRTDFQQSGGLAYWPQRCCPTSMVERKGSWRLCHDLSWPHPGTVEGVDSPNLEDAPVMIVTFVRISHLGRSASIMSLSGLPILFWKFDLSKAYKRSGQQAAGLWRRTTWSEFGSQTMERVPFGGADGPSFFSRQTNFMVFVIRRELEYADQSYPPRDPRVVAYQLARLEAAQSISKGQANDNRDWLILAFIMCFIDDFGACSIADLLFRIDGSPVRNAAGIQQHRAWLHWEVAILTVRRLGHILELDDPSKAVSPSRKMLLIGVQLDADRLEIELDPLKRLAYADSLHLWMQKGKIPAARLTSLAFKMLVVCECYPLARQWLHPIFRSLRGHRQRPIILCDETDVGDVLQRFFNLLSSEARIAVPMAARESFPFSDVEALLVYFSDASGDDSYLTLHAPDSSPDHLPKQSPGFGFWAVRGRKLLYSWGLFTPEEARALSINALELITMLWAEITLSPAQPDVSHVLAFTDNTAGEWTARRETPQALAMQLLAERRAEFLRQSSLFVRVGRVASADNRWADMFSRQRADEVLAEAVALGLTCERLHIPERARDLSWLIARMPA